MITLFILEVIIIIILTKRIGKLAIKKGLKPLKWGLYNALIWLAGKIACYVICFSVNQPNVPLVFFSSFPFALTVFFVLKSNLNNKPDINDINKIGEKDLYS